jgi:hypothetical protein
MPPRPIKPEQRLTADNAPTGAAREETRPFTAKQGQYLAFIYYYTKIHGVAPAEAGDLHAENPRGQLNY